MNANIAEVICTKDALSKLTADISYDDRDKDLLIICILKSGGMFFTVKLLSRPINVVG
jgi:hypoxanthine-guanine phosphoribosyltransferase